MAQIYQSYNRNLQVGEIYEANCYGKYISILTWNNPIDLLISIEGQNFSPIKAGMSVRLPEIDKPFYLIRFQNVTGGIVYLEYAVSDGQIVDSRFTAVGVINVLIPGLNPANGYGLVPISNVAPGTLAIAANALRRSVIIRNLAANAGDMVIGFDNLLTLANYIVRLAPGEVYGNDDYTGDIYILATVNLENISFGEV